MPGKGSSNGCCCTSCEEIPFTAPSVANQPLNPGVPLDPISFAGNPLDLTQGFCCSCLPKSACVTVTCYDSGRTVKGLFDLRCNINSDSSMNGTAVLYGGTLMLGEEDVDLEFSISVDDAYQCWFRLTSYALNLFEDSKLIDADARSAPQFFCYTLTTNPANIGQATAEHPTEWLSSGAGCGLVSVTIARDDLTPITRRRTFVDPATGQVLSDDSPIKNVCRGCGCICTKACISLQYPRENIIVQGTVPLTSQDTGTAECPHIVTQNYYDLEDPLYGIRISLVANADDNDRCALQLEATGYALSFSTPPDLWPLVDDTGTDCPHPSAMWNATDADGFPIIVRFDCATCGDCSVMGGAGCCPDTAFPRVLHCTIEKGQDVPSSFCECLPITIPLIYTGPAPAWAGTYKTTASNESWCFPSGDHDIGIQLVCTPLGWQLTFGTSLGAASPCAGTELNPELTCEPLEMIFTHAEFCCGMGGPSSVVFTITE